MITRTSKTHDDEGSKPTMLQILVDYLTNTPLISLMVHMVYIGMICLFLSLSYVAAFHWSSLIELYESANTHQQFSTNLKMSAATDQRITEELQRIMEETGGMRAYVYRYHNGLASISGVPFFFQTNTHEVISPGASRLMGFEQRIPASIHVAMNNAFVTDKCMMIPDTTLDKNSQNYYFFQSRNAVSVLRCPIYMENGDLFGFVGIDWNHKMAEDQKMMDRLHTLAATFSNMFATNHK